jgi:putative acetyltransferase
VREDRLSVLPRRNASAVAASIWQADSAGDVAQARTLFLEYAHWLNVDLCFQGFGAELAGLPGDYAPPHGRLLLAGARGSAFGCVALRALDAAVLPATTAPRAGEIKRMYVRPAQRGQRWGRRLGEALIAEARAIGYHELKLDTLAWMAPARALYAELGFRECAPYYANPLPDVVYMSLQLSPAKRAR